MMKLTLEEVSIQEGCKEIISCLISILRKVDLSLYGEKSDQPVVAVSENKIANDLNWRHHMNSPENANLTITSESEIT